MAPTDRKRLQLEQREELLLDIAQKIVTVDGFAGLTMEKVAARSSYSKGTVYNHFGSKEDLLCALGLRSILKFIEMLEGVQCYDAFSRKQLLMNAYTYQLFSRLEPALFMAILTAKTPAVIEKACPERLQESNRRALDVMTLCDRAVELAFESGDLSVSTPGDFASITFACWSSAFGLIALQQNAANAVGIQRLESADMALLFSMNLMLDGLGWKPLSTEYDYTEFWNGLGDKHFSDLLNGCSKDSSGNAILL